MEIKKNRVALEQIQKESFLVDSAKQNYEFEKYKFKVIGVGEEVADKSILNRVIVKSMQHGTTVEIKGKDITFIREEDIIAVI